MLDHSRDMSLEIGKYESIYDLVIDAEENDLLDDKEALNEEETETE